MNRGTWERVVAADVADAGDAAERWTRWLDAGAICAPDGARVRISTVRRLPDTPPHHPLLIQGDVAIARVAGDDLLLHWGPGLGEARIDHTTPQAEVVLSSAGRARLDRGLASFGMLLLIFLQRRAGLHHLHAASLRDPLGRGWLVSGASGQGKSTTTAILGRSGWAIGGDDAAFLRRGRNSVEAIPWRAPMALREDAFGISGTPMSGVRDPRREKWLLPLDTLPDATASIVTPRVLAFVEAGRNHSTALIPVTRAEALTRLLQDSPWVFLEPQFADEHLRLIETLVRTAACIRLQVGRDLPDVAATLHERVNVPAPDPSP